MTAHDVAPEAAVATATPPEGAIFASPVTPSVADNWKPLSAALGLPDDVPPIPAATVDAATEANALAASAPAPAQIPVPAQASVPAAPAMAAPAMTAPLSAPAEPAMIAAPQLSTPQPSTPLPMADAPTPVSPGEPVPAHVGVAGVFAAGSGQEATPLQPPVGETAASPTQTEAVAVEVASSASPAEAPLPNADLGAVAPSAAEADGTETTLRLSEILPDSQRRGTALFGIQDDSTAELSSDMLTSASRLQAPLDSRNVSPALPAWQQPMGAPLTTGISSSLTPAAPGLGPNGLNGNLPTEPADDLFR
ncbi:MAG: hypothetical protein LBL92_06935, partial [Propionibacteriaceae bacterium]|nr:hypothetical protein [Propionibacteriaceae bacterium]